GPTPALPPDRDADGGERTRQGPTPRGGGPGRFGGTVVAFQGATTSDLAQDPVRGLTPSKSHPMSPFLTRHSLRILRLAMPEWQPLSLRRRVQVEIQVFCKDS